MDWLLSHWFEISVLALLALIAFLQWLRLNYDKTWREARLPARLASMTTAIEQAGARWKENR